MKKFTLTIDEHLFEKLHKHLFPGDGDEHGAIIVAGIAETKSEIRLLSRELFLAQDGVDYVPGKHGYRALTAQFVAEVSDYCARENLCYLAVHCHRGKDSVYFSSDDINSHEKGYPSLIDITHGGPVGALVFAENAVAGDIWTQKGRFELAHAKIIGNRIYKIYPEPKNKPKSADPVYDRSTRLFGDIGQQILKNMKVGIVGLGGGGSLLNEWLSYLGVGHIIAIDFDKIDHTNLPRVVGATSWDAKTFLTKRRSLMLKKIGKYLSTYKVNIAKRVAKKANQSIKFEPIIGNILNETTAKSLRDVDFIFLATDNTQSRLVFNALVHQYLIPGVQIGIKVPKDKVTQKIGEIVANTRPVLPFPNGGCLECHDLISPSKLQEESLSREELKAQRYVDDKMVHEPSVITLNVLSAAQAINDLMMLFMGLYEKKVVLEHQINFARKREPLLVENCCKQNCLDCSNKTLSRRARGDRKRLPCRMN